MSIELENIPQLSVTCTLQNKFVNMTVNVCDSIFFHANISISFISIFEQDRYFIMFRDELLILCGKSFKIYNVTYWNVWI